MPKNGAPDGAMTQETVQALAQTIQIALTEKETQQITAELEAALTYISPLMDEIDDSLPITSHPIAITNVMRADEITDVLTQEEALENAPEVADGMFRVNSIMGGEQ